MPAPGRLRLGELLINAGLITEGQLNEAMARQRKTRERLGEALVNLGVVTEEALGKTLAQQLNVPFATAGSGLLTPAKDKKLNEVIPEDLARKNRVLPINATASMLTLAIVDPLDILLLDNLRNMTGREISLLIATRSEIDKAINTFYGTKDYLKEAVAETYQATADTTIETLPGEGEERANLDEMVAKAGEAGVVKLVDLILREAINSHASDIHIEPAAKRLSIRYRIDGELHQIEPPAVSLMAAILSRIKIMSKMDITEKRLPQDGGFSVKLAEKAVDVRVSSVPTIYGEKIVMRLLDKADVVLDFTALGITGRTLEDLEKAIHAPYGLILITGPTGSGKTTTLYTALSRINEPSVNIMTIEDPVEYRLPGINQVQAKQQIGLTFAAGLRAFLRQDPDIVMVGEIRDLETAEIGARAALTGHLVLSTLHTNDAPSAVTRLLDIGVEPFLISPSLVMVLAQRLVRRLCKACKESYEPSEAIIAQLPSKTPIKTLYRPKGCDLCRKTGYKGRMGIHEGLYVTDAIRDLIAQRAPAGKIRDAARAGGMKTLVEDGVEKAAAGLTSIEEVLSVAMVQE